MKIPYMIVIMAVCFGVPAHAAQDGNLYGGVQYAMVTYDEEGFDEVEPTALVGRFGRFFNKNVALEGRFGIGLDGDEIDLAIPGFAPFEAEVEVEMLYGAYIVAHSDPTQNVNFYGVIGYSRGELEVSIGDFSQDGDESGLSYGAGINIGRLNIEYMSYLDEDEFDATAISIGYISSFD